MVKKTTTKRSATKKTSTKKTSTKKINSTNEKDSSTTIMLLTAIGLVLLIYFGSNISVDAKIEINPTNEIKEIENGFFLDGKSYSSKAEAKEKLTGMPQTQISDEERLFIEGYKE
tara:strand:+ start:106 stop:450 length:345 start_codon:yes stop_codon:yes gene_type:complete